MAELRKDIPVTNEFDGYEPPEDMRTYGGTYSDDSRMMMEEPSRRTMFDEAQTSSGAERNLDYAPGGSPAPAPVWWNGKKIDTTLFCEEYLKTHNLRSINGTFFTPDGYCPADKLRYAVYDEIKQYVRNYAIQTSANIVENLKAEAKTDELMISEDILNLRDGTLDIARPEDMTDEKKFCRNRLPVTVNADGKKTSSSPPQVSVNSPLRSTEILSPHGFINTTQTSSSTR